MGSPSWMRSYPVLVSVSGMFSVDSAFSALNGFGRGRWLDECDPGRSAGSGGGSWTVRERETRWPPGPVWKKVRESIREVSEPGWI